ncbi:efflux RND transporter permease subunit [Luminiphilus sp. nBUS_07]|uniref:efflux RND transporter permease subunit n=1 Tax=Luminiphilus sp. nBUS_07 TaxID=3395314 RepID=UPI003EB77C97
MKALISWFVRNPIAANLLMFSLVVGGLLGLIEVRKEEFPNIDVPTITVSVPYLGAAPSEVETGVCIRIEEAVQGIEGIDKVKTTAAENRCVVALELTNASFQDRVLDDVKAQVNAISTFPANTEKPVVASVSLRSVVMYLAISGDTDERSLKNLTESLREEILEISSVSLVDTMYVRPDEISVEIPELTLRRHGLTLEAVAKAIRQSSIDIPGGSIKSDAGEIRLRSTAQRYTGRELEDVPVITNSNGTRILLRDIAVIRDGFEEQELSAMFDGRPTQLLKVWRLGKDNTLAMARDLTDFVEVKQRSLPSGLELRIWSNEADDLVDRLSTLINNATGGLLLVILTLALFLRLRLALWVTAGIPVSILGAIAFFPSADLGISTLSLMGFLLSLGILVDDAIVVGERIHTHEGFTQDSQEAAVNGTTEVAIPVFFGVLTTMAAFIPIVTVDSMLGSFFGAIGWTVLLCLVFSLVESQLVLPAHLAHRSKERGTSAIGRRWESFQEKVSDGLERFAQRQYQQALSYVLKYRYATLGAALAALIIILGLLASGRVIFQFFPTVSGNEIYASLELPEGYPVERTTKALELVQTSADQLIAELNQDLPKGASAVINQFKTIGLPISKSEISGSSESGSHIAEMSITLLPHGERGGMTPKEAARRWRELTPDIPDVIEKSFTASAVSLGEDINIQIRGKDLEVMSEAAAALTEVLSSFDAIYDISDSYRAGKQELVVRVRPEAESLGLTQADLGTQVRHAFYGAEAQRVQRGRDDMRIMVRYPESDRRSLDNYNQLYIRLPNGAEVPIETVASAQLSAGNATIRRVDGQRTINVTAYADRTRIAPESVLRLIESQHIPRLESEYPGTTFSLAGEAEERASALSGLARTSLLALIIIYTLLAVPLKSYLQPLVVMASIPFGFIGAVLGHFILGYDLVFFSILGIVALSGVVINASLVLVDFINKRRLDVRLSVTEAVTLAGVSRFRPIFLTSVTTFVGLLPLMLNADLATAPFVPLAVSLGFGVIFATSVTLLLIPALYLILHDLSGSPKNTNKIDSTAER